jgi:hypothetical protein
MSSSLAGGRVIFRTAAYAVSLLALAFASGRTQRRQPAARLALVLTFILALEAINPDTSTLLAAGATIGIYLAILGPIFWVPRLALDVHWFRRIAIVIWSFQSISAFVGALQVYFPGVFQPAVASVLSDSYVASLQITLSNGEEILRPSGLSDAPGGAAVAGTYAIVLALGLWSERPKVWMQLLLAFSIAVGLFVLYVCQVRSFVVMVVIAVASTSIAHALHGRFRKVASFGTALGLIATGSFVAAVSVGGESVTRRLQTLIESSPTEVYYTNRGIFLEHTLTELLPQYPFGAGLGRWGTLAGYFAGSSTNVIYVEIQWTGWLLDGGVLLIGCYAAMIILTLVAVWRIAKTTSGADDRGLANWAAMLIGYDVGTVALTFNFPVFMSGFGMDFWLLNSALLVIAWNGRRATGTSQSKDPRSVSLASS